MKNALSLTLAVALLLVTAALYAAQIIPTPLPYIFTAGTVIDPSQMNANFNTIVTNVNANALNSKAPNTVGAWASYADTATTGPVTVYGNYNVSSISYNASNHYYTVTFINPLNNASYAVIFSQQCQVLSGGSLGPAQQIIASQAANNFQFFYSTTTTVPTGTVNTVSDCYTGNSYNGMFTLVGGY